MITKNTIKRLKDYYHNEWNPEQYGYIALEIHTGAICPTNNIDCNGNPHFNYKTFPKRIKKWEDALNQEVINNE